MVQVAIIGTGGISDSHIWGYLEFPEKCEIVALVDIYPEKAVQKAEKYGLKARIYNDHRLLLNDGDFDLASICTPPYVHAEIAINSLNAGKHVLVEKPMATSLQECDQMLNAAQANGKLLSIVAQNRFKTPNWNLKKMVEQNVIGKIVHAQVDSFWWRGQNYYDLWWRGTWGKEGGGCTLNHAVHQIDLFQWIIGMPAELQAVIANVAHDNSEVEDFSTTVLRYANGGIGQITASLLHHGEPQQFVIQGERATIAAPWKVVASKQKENGFPEPDPALATEIQARYDRLPELAYTGHTGQIANVLAALEGKEDLLIDGHAGRRTIELITAIYYSGTHGEKVKLPLTPSNPFYTTEGILAHAPRFHPKTKSVENFADDAIIVGASSDQPSQEKPSADSRDHS
ncbi:MAG: Gfo/Idh/MocA family oxidoreductase [Chloroflexi bacterium]|nr:Gfo/Idh/MocA family oxidoreductase [Chloroflexota bacterium]